MPDYDKLTQEQRRQVREDYILSQGGLCYHCKEPLSGPPAEHIRAKKIQWSLFPGGKHFLDYPVHLHHDHILGHTIGAVHALCNAVLWQYHGE